MPSLSAGPPPPGVPWGGHGGEADPQLDLVRAKPAHPLPYAAVATPDAGHPPGVASRTSSRAGVPSSDGAAGKRPDRS
jgi:hypothetical protein